MDFGTLPPEINSGRLYTGPGPGTLLSASQMWADIAAELHFGAESCWSTVSALTAGAWLGPSSAEMAAAVVPYITWLTASALQAEQTACQTKAAASAYETALAMTVPPAVIAANRSVVATLIATNVLGQNAPQIAAAEAAYYEMWAQDATAMYSYAASAAAAAAVEPFASPPPTSAQADRAVKAAGVPEPTAPQLLSAVPNALQGLASPTVPSSTTETISLATGLNMLSYPARFATYPMNFLSKALGFSKTATAPASAVAAGAAAIGTASGIGPPAGPGATAPAISASLGQARLVGPMSVPHSWSGLPAAPLVASLVGNPSGAGAASPAVSTATPMLPFLAGSGRSATAPTPRYDLRPTVISRSPAAG